MSELYKYYSTAMGRRRTPIEEEAFLNYMTQESVITFWHKDSAILGQMRGGIFCPSHFCPKTDRQGVEMLLAMKADTQVCVFAVTEDLVGMLSRLGFKRIPNITGIKDEKRGYKKYLLTNSRMGVLKTIVKESRWFKKIVGIMEEIRIARKVKRYEQDIVLMEE